MRITKWGEYGILCSLYLARQSREGPVGATEIASAYELPVQYAQQILHRLRKGNVITTTRGPKGGYRLARPAAQISLRDILQAAEGETFELICDASPLFSHECARDSSCALRPVWEELRRAIDSVLGHRTLADLAASSAEPNRLIQISQAR